MLPVLIFFTICTGEALSYEIHQRPTKIRFPTEATPLTQQIYTVGPSQLYEAESQAVPIIIKGINPVPFTVLQQVPIANIPFGGDIGPKGYHDGMMPYYQPLIRQDSEFHHTVPSTIRIPSYTHHKTMTITKPKQPVQLQNIQHKPQRHQDRVRVPSQKYSPLQHVKTKPNNPILQQSYTQVYHNKDIKSNMPSLPMVKYPVAMQHLPHHMQYNEYQGNDYEEEVYRRPTPPNKLRGGPSYDTKPIPQYSEEYNDFEDKIPEWKLKSGGTGIRDTNLESNINHYYKKQRPEQDDSKYYDEDTEESFSYEEPQHYVSPQNYNKYAPLKNTNLENYKPKNEIKKLREPTYDNLKPHNYHVKPTSVEFFSSKDITDTLPFISKNEKYKHPLQLYNAQKNKKLQEPVTPKLITGSEWIPINAPDGALPAKSYDIPAPDLSRGQHGNGQWYDSHESTEEQRVEHLDHINNQRPSSNIVYGGRKPQREGVVSASVMVKQ